MSKPQHEAILPVCEERFLVKDKLIRAAWVVGLTVIGAAASATIYVINAEKSVNTAQDTRIEKIEDGMPDMRSVQKTLDKIVEQNEELIKRDKTNNMRHFGGSANR